MRTCTCQNPPAPDGTVLHSRGCVALAKAGAEVIPPPDAVTVGGQSLNLLDGLQLIRAKDASDVRFIVMPVPDRHVVLLTLGHQRSGDQYCFPLDPDFAEQFGQMLARSARQARGINGGGSPPHT